MFRNQSKVSVRGIIIWFLFSQSIVILSLGFAFNSDVIISLSIIMLLTVYATNNRIKKSKEETSEASYLNEKVHESKLDLTNRVQYPADISINGNEWVLPSIYTTCVDVSELQVSIGGKQCGKPYAMGVLNTNIDCDQSGNIRGRNNLINTPELDLKLVNWKSSDLSWHINMEYRGCKDINGRFSPELFKEIAVLQNIKMVEFDLSVNVRKKHSNASVNSASNSKNKSAINNTVNIPKLDCSLPNATEIMKFIGYLKELSGSKPVGLKMRIGTRQEFVDICNAMIVTRITSDFITLEGSEDINQPNDNIGLPLFDSIAFVADTLELFNLRSSIRIIATCRDVTSFNILKAIALGADLCLDNSKIDYNGNNKRLNSFATKQQDALMKDHGEKVEGIARLMEQCGFKNLKSVSPNKFYRRVDSIHSKNLQEIYFNHTISKLTEEFYNVIILN